MEVYLAKCRETSFLPWNAFVPYALANPSREPSYSHNSVDRRHISVQHRVAFDGDLKGHLAL